MERRGSQYSQDAVFRFESSKSLLRFSTPGVLVYETFRKLLKIKYGNNIMKETKQ